MTVNLVQKAFIAKFEIMQHKLNAMTDSTVDLGHFQLDPVAQISKQGEAKFVHLALHVIQV